MNQLTNDVLFGIYNVLDNWELLYVHKVKNFEEFKEKFNENPLPFIKDLLDTIDRLEMLIDNTGFYF